MAHTLYGIDFNKKKATGADQDEIKVAKDDFKQTPELYDDVMLVGQLDREPHQAQGEIARIEGSRVYIYVY